MVLVFGSINIDLVARVETFPCPGETVSGLSFAIYPGGKGANQALASARAGAPTWLVGAVGRDAFADRCTRARRARPRSISPTSPGSTSHRLCDDSGLGRPARTDRIGVRRQCTGRPSRDSRLADHPKFDGVAAARASGGGESRAHRRARRNGSRVVLNASPWRPLSMDSLCSVDCLIVNEAEAAALAAGFGWPRSAEGSCAGGDGRRQGPDRRRDVGQARGAGCSRQLNRCMLTRRACAWSTAPAPAMRSQVRLLLRWTRTPRSRMRSGAPSQQDRLRVPLPAPSNLSRRASTSMR